VVVVDSSPLSAAGRLADSFELVPTADSPEFVDEVLRIAKFHQASIIIPTIDPEISVYSAHRERFRAAEVGVWVSGPEVARLGADKWDLYGWLTRNGFPTVTTVEKNDPSAAAMAGPVVAKPRAGSSSIGVMVAAGLVLLVGANAHLVYVAFQSQPECVDHLKEPGSESGKFRAAKSAC